MNIGIDVAFVLRGNKRSAEKRVLAKKIRGTMNTNIFTDYDLQALVDNELSHEEIKEIQAYIKSNPTAQKRYDELVKQKNLLKLWWKNNKH